MLSHHAFDSRLTIAVAAGILFAPAVARLRTAEGNQSRARDFHPSLQTIAQVIHALTRDSRTPQTRTASVDLFLHALGLTPSMHPELAREHASIAVPDFFTKGHVTLYQSLNKRYHSTP